eukprot:863861-Pyramimonas_sp.AAC.1
MLDNIATFEFQNVCGGEVRYNNSVRTGGKEGPLQSFREGGPSQLRVCAMKGRLPPRTCVEHERGARGRRL